MRYLVLALLLAGCGGKFVVSGEEQARLRKVAAEEDARIAAESKKSDFQKLEEQCATYGFKPGTNEMATCIMQADLAAKQRRASGGPTVCNRVGNTLICN